MRRVFTFAIFLGIFSLFLFIANAVVYEALAAMFFIVALWQLILLGAALGVLSASFIVATILGSRYYNLFTRIYYTAAAVWIGCFVYFFFAAVLYGLVVLISGQLLPLVGQALMFAALLVSVYGLLHARTLAVKEVSVALPHLPEAWRNKKAVWISDLHLGQLHGPKFAARVVSKVNSLPHDIIFIGGDLFDGTGAPDLGELLQPLKNFKASLGTFFITGNHEEFGESKKFIAAVRDAGITTLIDEKIEIDGLQIIGVDYHNASDKARFKEILGKLSIDPNKPSILLKHEPKDLDVARDANISLQISGHTHRAQQWPLEYMAKLAYKGFSYGLKPLGSLQVYVSSGVGTWGPPLRVGTNCEIVVFSFKKA